MSQLPTPKEDLAHVFRAMYRGTKRSKLRVAVVVCPRDHTVVEVYRGVSGTFWGIFATNLPNSGKSRSSKAWRIADLSRSTHRRPGKTTLTAHPLWCRCSGEDLRVFTEDIRTEMEAGRRRIRIDYARLDADSLQEINASGLAREYSLSTHERVSQ